MRRIFINKWFILATFLTISLSVFAFMASQEASSSCKAARQCCQKANSAAGSDVSWDFFSLRLPSVSFQ